jgi:hypothetical protein
MFKAVREGETGKGQAVVRCGSSVYLGPSGPPFTTNDEPSPPKDWFVETDGASGSEWADYFGCPQERAMIIAEALRFLFEDHPEHLDKWRHDHIILYGTEGRLAADAAMRALRRGPKIKIKPADNIPCDTQSITAGPFVFWDDPEEDGYEMEDGESPEDK